MGSYIYAYYFFTSIFKSILSKFCQNIEIHQKNTNEIVKSLYLSSTLRPMLTEKSIDEIVIDLDHFNECQLRNSELKSISELIFKQLTNLKIINLSWNSLCQIEASTFTSLTQLELLDLSGNRFERFAPNLFKGLGKLTCLWFQNNQLTDLDVETFSGLVSLSHVHMSSNRLTHLHVDTFKGLHNLKEIVMSNNKWSDVNTFRLNLEKSVKYIAFKKFWDDNNISDVINCE